MQITTRHGQNISIYYIFNERSRYKYSTSQDRRRNSGARRIFSSFMHVASVEVFLPDF